MTPCFAITNQTDGWDIYAELFGQLLERMGWPARDDCNHILFGKFVVPVALALRGLSTKFSERMAFVLRLRHIFEIFQSIVAFVSILVIHSHPMFTWTDKCFGYQSMNKDSFNLTLVLEDNPLIAITVRIGGHDFYTDAANPAKAGDPIQAIIIRNGTPFFAHDFNYIPECLEMTA